MTPPSIHRYLALLMMAAFLPPFALAGFLLAMDIRDNHLFDEWSITGILGVVGLVLMLPGIVGSVVLGIRLARASQVLAAAARSLGAGTPISPICQPMPCHEFEQVAILLSAANENQMARDFAAQAERAAAISQQQELERSNAELEQFAYVASHDLREPIRMVTSFLGLLERRLGAKLDADAREFLDFARDGARRMDHMVLDLLDYSRVGRHQDEPDVVDVEGAIAEAVRRLTDLIATSGASIEIGGPMPQVPGRTAEIVRLFQNLISNACKYRHPDRAPTIRISAKAEGNTWQFEVADNGIGIAPHDCERVFQIFQRLHGSEIEGNGIGLAICKKVAEHHGGGISAIGRPGEGTTFRIVLNDTAKTLPRRKRAAE